MLGVSDAKYESRIRDDGMLAGHDLAVWASVVAVPAVQRIAALLPLKVVVPGEAADHVVAVPAGESVRCCIAPQAVAEGRPRDVLNRDQSVRALPAGGPLCEVYIDADAGRPESGLVWRAVTTLETVVPWAPDEEVLAAEASERIVPLLSLESSLKSEPMIMSANRDPTTRPTPETTSCPSPVAVPIDRSTITPCEANRKDAVPPSVRRR